MAVFFYGLFMDVDLLRGRGVQVQESRVARLHDYQLRIGARATLVAAPGQTVHGVVMWVTADDVRKLYADPSVNAYVPQRVDVIADGERIEAVCYNLPASLHVATANPAYAQKLRILAESLGFPAHYLAEIERAGQGVHA